MPGAVRLYVPPRWNVEYRIDGWGNIVRDALLGEKTGAQALDMLVPRRAGLKKELEPVTQKTDLVVLGNAYVAHMEEYLRQRVHAWVAHLKLVAASVEGTIGYMRYSLRTSGSTLSQRARWLSGLEEATETIARRLSPPREHVQPLVLTTTICSIQAAYGSFQVTPSVKAARASLDLSIQAAEERVSAYCIRQLRGILCD